MVTKKPKGLGLGLEALLGPKVSDTPTAPGAPTELLLAQLRPGKYQPRTRMDEGSLYELAESIKSQGVMQPVLVRPVSAGSNGDDGASAPYEIIAGERRVRAAALAGLDRVPVLVKAVPDEAAAVMALIENIQREDLNPLEEAQGLQRLIGEFQLTHEQAAQAVGRSRSAASNLLRLLHLAEPVQTALVAGDLDMGHARALLALPPAQQVMAGQEIVAKKLSVREAERLVTRQLAPAAARAPRDGAGKSADKGRDITRLEEKLADQLAAAVEIRLSRRAKPGRKGSERGEIAIRFDSLDELNGLLDKLGVTER
ncbi:MAG: ParB/RepB/Spo0J family partition protein [Betaproteobacteria bacterium]|nr:ParB/RepB/Spo0J family partition protein [Betaproteobacteria bacterium]